MSINSSGKQGKGITLLQRVDRLKALKIKSGEKEANFKSNSGNIKEGLSCPFSAFFSI